MTNTLNCNNSVNCRPYSLLIIELKATFMLPPLSHMQGSCCYLGLNRDGVSKR